MKFSSISIKLIAICLGSLAGNSFGELIMIRQTPQRTGDPYKLTCVSKNLDAAFVWNDDLRSPVQPKNIVPMQPRITQNHTSPRRNDSIAIWQENSAWREVNSAGNPMNPVFDSRWEDFRQFSFPRDDFKNEYQYVRNVPKSGTLIFSARGLGDINIRLCEKDKLVSTNPCFWITVPAWPNTTCVIRSCLWGKTEDGQLSQDLCNGEESVCKLSSPSVIDASEWRTFALKWDTDYSQLKTYSGIKHNFKKHFQISKNVNHLFVQSSVAGHIRFHFYNYLLTRQNNVTLSSVPFLYTYLNYRIELLVSLCVECELQVQVIITLDEKRRKIIRNISGDQNFVDNELATWQIVELGLIPREFYGRYVTLEIVPISKSPSAQCWWAIDSLPKYRPVGYIKTSTRTFDGLSNPTSSALPIVSCQQLSYSRNVVISSNASITQKISIRLPNCTSGQVGPGCIFSCTNSCKGTSICDQSDCICAPGIMGRNCSTELRMLTARNITDTTALVCYPESLYLEKTNNLRFQIKITQKNHNPMTVNELWNITVENPRESTEITIANLAPGTTYIMQAVVTIKGPIEATNLGPEANFTTSCTAPSVPLKLDITTQGRGVVTLRWIQPQYSAAKILRFDIDAHYIQTKLTRTVEKLSITQPVGNNSLRLNLYASTKYNLSVRAVNKCGYGQSATRTYWVPSSMGFPDGQDMVVTRNRTFITATIPPIVNTTTYSTAKVIVKGSPICANESSLQTVPDNWKKLLNMTISETGWITETFPAQENCSKYLTIGNEPTHDILKNCHLSPEETHVVIVVVFDELEQALDFITSSTLNPIYDATRENPYLIWLVIFLILPACLLLLLFFYRKRQNYYARMESLPSVKYDDVQPINPPVDCSLDCYPHLAKSMEFENQIQLAVHNGELESEFAMLPRGLVKSYQYGNLPENKPKNRYGSLIAYDETRVILEKETSDFHSDYINANYIQGYRKERAYIATQGPKTNTIADFWKMIWQEEVRVICMLINVIEDGEKMCEQYWPKVGRTVEYGHITILNVSQRVYADYTYRTFQLTTNRKAESRKVEHLQYTSWPKTGVPMYFHSIVEYLNELRSVDPGRGPIVVHCSAGTGRTGTIILCDISLNYTLAEETVDSLAEAQKMYDARANMLDNLQQYILAHLMSTRCLLFLPTKLPCSDVSREKIEELKRDLPTHIRRLEVSSWKNKALCPSEPLRLPNPEHLAKNRFPKFTPVKHSLVRLKRYPINDSGSDYISAISVDGVRVEKQYLASQLPLPSTLADFWRLVAEQKVELIVILQRPNAEDLSCVDIIPYGTTLIPVPFIKVENKESFDSNEHFTTDHLSLTDTSEEQARTQNVTVLTCNNWNLVEDAKPPSPEALVALWLASERVSRAEGPTLVLCHDGVTGCGLYMALSILLERMTVERECDVILAVQVVRRSRAEFVYSKAQFEYLYEAAVYYAESFETYSNFA